MSLLLLLIGYLYNPADWQYYPRLDDICNFTSTSYNTVYAATSNAIVQLDENTNMPKRVFTPSIGLNSLIYLVLYDNSYSQFWILTNSGRLFTYNPEVQITKEVNLSVPIKRAKRLGINKNYVFIDHASTITAVDKLRETEANAEADSQTVWVDKKRVNLQKAYPFLAPWQMLSEELTTIPYSDVYVNDGKAYVTVKGYGYLVFNALSWVEDFRYQSPRANEIHSMFTYDSSLYIFGKNGVDQIILSSGSLYHHPYYAWGTTLAPKPAWSIGISGKLRRISYNKAKLIEGNLFLFQKNRTDVFNIKAKIISQISAANRIYDADFNRDSLFIATDNGVYLTLLKDTLLAALRDARSKIFRNDVLGIVRGNRARYFWTGSLTVKQTGKKWEYYPAPAFIPLPQKAITGRDSLIVVGGKGGVSIYNPETYFQLRLTTNEGLLSNDVTDVYLDGNYLWIASNAGLQRFDLGAVLP